MRIMKQTPPAHLIDRLGVVPDPPRHGDLEVLVDPEGLLLEGGSLAVGVSHPQLLLVPSPLHVLLLNKLEKDGNF